MVFVDLCLCNPKQMSTDHLYVSKIEIKIHFLSKKKKSTPSRFYYVFGL